MASTLPLLHVEVLLTSSEHRETIVQQLLSYLKQQFITLPMCQALEDLENFDSRDRVKAVTFQELEGNHGRLRAPVNEVRIYIHAYHIPQTPATIPLDDEDDGDEDTSLDTTCLQATTLPAADIDRDWDELVFDSPVKFQLLNMVVKCTASTPERHRSNLFVFHGPPGTGKSSLSRCLAHKGSIRLQQSFPNSTLLHINVAGLLDRYIGGSQKLITYAFDKIRKIASDSKKLCFVVIDEVESIVGTRDREYNSASGNREVMRATNRLLTCFDEVKKFHNVFIFCTSNQVDLLDSAFVTRVHRIEHIPLPGLQARYEILQQCFADLIKRNTVDTSGLSQPRFSLPSNITISSDATVLWGMYARSKASTDEYQSQHCGRQEPLKGFVHAKQFLMDGTLSPSVGVLFLAMMCQGLCGRTIRQVPCGALSMAGRDRFTIHEAFGLTCADLSKALADMR